MKFNRLQASISNNADQSPSLYMALCAVESLFADLEDNCGAEISRCPVGDERLPSKLVWLCRVINEIYWDQSDDLQRNRGRLDTAMEKLRDTQKKLEESSTVAEQLASLQAEYAVLERQLQGRTTAAEECELLAAKCQQAKRKLESLSTFNPNAAEAELRKLNADIASQENTKAALLAQLEQAGECVDDLRQEVDRLQAKEQDMRKQFLSLREQQQLTRKENVQLREELNALEADFTASKEDGRQLIAKRDEVQHNIDLVRRKIVEFREENLAAKLAELETVQKEMAELETNQAEFDQECDRIKSQRNQLILDIAHKRAENESLSEKLAISQKNREGLEKEKARLEAILSDCLQELETLQTAVDQLTEIKIPEAQELQNQEQLRLTELQQSVEQTQVQLDTYQNEITKLNDLLPKLEEEVKNNRVVYDALTASCAASSTELESLERQIAELRNNTDGQKLVIYRKQLEENQQELENIQMECERIKQETALQGQKLEELQNERARLRELKDRHEQGVAVTEKQLRDLEFVATEKYLHEVNALDARAKLMETVRSKMAASIANMHKILGQAPVDENISLEDQMKYDLREMRTRIDDLRGTLVACAQSLKMEER